MRRLATLATLAFLIGTAAGCSDGPIVEPVQGSPNQFIVTDYDDGLSKDDLASCPGHTPAVRVQWGDRDRDVALITCEGGR